MSRRLLIPFFFAAGALLGGNLEKPFAQTRSEESGTPQAGWFSLGGRSTLSVFGHDGAGLGTGGQFRVQLGNRVNTEWFADYILVPYQDFARSEYVHIGWSVIFYPVSKWQWPSSRWQPFVLAGHCFDYNQKTFLGYPGHRRHRWGAAVQAGAGCHLHLSERYDLTLETQYMIHLTPEILPENLNGHQEFVTHSHAGLEGHWLTTLSFNYKVARLWKRKK
ncbi:MAG: hypothetical protein N2050_00545 [Flavobacteriales bacterium]|nr:hypothetical protein [Flavobacteriales bacterium]